MAAPAPPRAAAGRHACRHLAATTTEPGRPSRARPTQPPHRCPASLASPVALAGPAPQPHQPPRPCSASQRLPATSGWPSALALPPPSLRAPKITSKKSKRGTVLTSTDLLQQQHRSTQRGRRDAGGRQRTDCISPQTAGMPPGASSSFPHHRQLPNPQASQADLPSTNPAGNLAISCGGDAAHHLFRYARGSNPCPFCQPPALTRPLTKTCTKRYTRPHD